MKNLILLSVCLVTVMGCNSIDEPIEKSSESSQKMTYSETAMNVFRDGAEIVNDRWVFDLPVEKVVQLGVMEAEYHDFQNYLTGLNQFLDRQEQQGSALTITKVDAAEQIIPQEDPQTRSNSNQSFVIWSYYNMPNNYSHRMNYTGSGKLGFSGYSNAPVYAITFTFNSDKVTFSQNSSQYSVVTGQEQYTQVKWDLGVESYAEVGWGEVTPPGGFTNQAVISAYISDPFSVNRSGVEVPSGFSMRSTVRNVGPQSPNIYTITISNYSSTDRYVSIQKKYSANTLMHRIGAHSEQQWGNFLGGDTYHVRINNTDQYAWAPYQWDTYAP